MCSIWQKNSVGEMTPAEVGSFFGKWPQFSWVHLTGGELFMRRDLEDLVAAIVERDRSLHLLNFPTTGWFGDRTVTACAWISGIGGAGFILRSLTFSRPVVDLRALAIRNFSLGCWFSFVTGVGIFGTVYLTPLFLGRVRGLDAWQIGTALLSAGVFQLMAVPVYSFFANRVDLR